MKSLLAFFALLLAGGAAAAQAVPEVAAAASAPAAAGPAPHGDTQGNARNGRRRQGGEDAGTQDGPQGHALGGPPPQMPRRMGMRRRRLPTRAASVPEKTAWARLRHAHPTRAGSGEGRGDIRNRPQQDERIVPGR